MADTCSMCKEPLKLIKGVWRICLRCDFSTKGGPAGARNR